MCRVVGRMTCRRDSFGLARFLAGVLSPRVSSVENLGELGVCRVLWVAGFIGAAARCMMVPEHPESAGCCGAVRPWNLAVVHQRCGAVSVIMSSHARNRNDISVYVAFVVLWWRAALNRCVLGLAKDAFCK